MWHLYSCINSIWLFNSVTFWGSSTYMVSGFTDHSISLVLLCEFYFAIIYIYITSVLFFYFHLFLSVATFMCHMPHLYHYFFIFPGMRMLIIPVWALELGVRSYLHCVPFWPILSREPVMSSQPCACPHVHICCVRKWPVLFGPCVH